MRNVLLIILFFALASINLDCSSKSGKRNTSSTAEYLEVTKVVDGDTFWADNGSNKGVKIRLIGVDAPESRKVFKKEVGYYGKEAKDYLKQMITGKKVRLISDVDLLDQYGRTLSYVYLEDGTFVNAELIKNGYAMIMTVPPNVKHSETFFKLQREARESNKGLWGIEPN